MLSSRPHESMGDDLVALGEGHDPTAYRAFRLGNGTVWLGSVSSGYHDTVVVRYIDGTSARMRRGFEQVAIRRLSPGAAKVVACALAMDWAGICRLGRKSIDDHRPAACEVFLIAASNLVETWPDRFGEAAKRTAIPLVLAAGNEFPDDERVSEHMVAAFGCIATVVGGRSAVVVAGALPLLIKAGRAFQDSSAVTEQLCRTLWRLALRREDILRWDVGGVLVGAIRGHMTNARLCAQACRALERACRAAPGSEAVDKDKHPPPPAGSRSVGAVGVKGVIARSGLVTALVLVLGRHGIARPGSGGKSGPSDGADDSDLRAQDHLLGTCSLDWLCACICRLLWSFSSCHPGNQARLLEHDVPRLMLQVLRRCPDDSDVQRSACAVIVNTTSDDAVCSEAMRDALVADGAVELATAILRRFGHRDTTVEDQASGILLNLIPWKPSAFDRARLCGTVGLLEELGGSNNADRLLNLLEQLARQGGAGVARAIAE